MELMRPALCFSFCFLSLRAWLKSPLGEPHSCCQATRLPGSRALMNSHRVMEVALPTRRTRGRTGGQHTCVCANIMPECGMCVQPEQTGHKCTQRSHVWVFLTAALAHISTVFSANLFSRNLNNWLLLSISQFLFN